MSITCLLCSTSSQKAFIIAAASCCITLLLQSGRRVLEANKQAGKPCRAGTYTLFLNFNKSGGTHPTYLNRMFFSGVKVNRNRALFFLTSSCNFPSPTTNSVFVFLALGGEGKSGNLFNCIPGFRGANPCKHAEPTVVVFIRGWAGWAHRGVLLLIPAQDEAVLPPHLLHPVFTDLSEYNTSQHVRLTNILSNQAQKTTF